jgi:uncharacterized membrane protein YkvA (DUF1232 family)
MSDDVEERALAAFGGWLASLPSDTRTIAAAVSDEANPVEVRRPLAGGLNYFFKSLDLIDDGIEGLGYLDDAFVLRVAAAQAKRLGPVPEAVAALAADVELIREFTGEIFGRLEAFVSRLMSGVVRGRSVDAIVDDVAVREELIGDVDGWASRYHTPAFVLDGRGLVKLRSFLAAKLP